MDIGYFVTYNLKVLKLSFKQLQEYIKRKQEEKKAANTFLKLGDINTRQAQIIKIFTDDPSAVVTVSDMRTKFQVSPTTTKSDITGLISKGILSEISFNKVKKGYIKGKLFNQIISSL